MTTVIGPFHIERPAGKSRSGESYWQITVRTGDLICYERFQTEAEAEARREELA